MKSHRPSRGSTPPRAFLLDEYSVTTLSELMSGQRSFVACSLCRLNDMLCLTPTVLGRGDPKSSGERVRSFGKRLEEAKLTVCVEHANERGF